MCGTKRLELGLTTTLLQDQNVPKEIIGIDHGPDAVITMAAAASMEDFRPQAIPKFCIPYLKSLLESRNINLRLPWLVK